MAFGLFGSSMTLRELIIVAVLIFALFLLWKKWSQIKTFFLKKLGKGLEYDLIPMNQALDEWNRNNQEEAIRRGVWKKQPLDYKAIDNFYYLVFPNRQALQLTAEKGKEVKAKAAHNLFFGFDRAERDMRHLRILSTNQSPRSDVERLYTFYPEYREQIMRREIEKETREGEPSRGVPPATGRRVAS